MFKPFKGEASEKKSNNVKSSATKYQRHTLSSVVSFIKLRASRNNCYETVDNKVHEVELFIDNDTWIVYIKSSDGKVLTPYIGKNGKYCRYYMGQIEELP